MSAKSLSKGVFPLIWMELFFLWPCAVAQALASDEVSWHTLETKHAIIHYQGLEDLEEFDDQVDYSPGDWGLKWLFSGSESKGLEKKLANKVDALFEKVQEILDMRKRMNKVVISIYNNEGQLHDAYYRLFKKTCRIRSWHVYESNTIYVNISDLNEGILAHEMAHHISDHYLVVRPPRATSEILARYVDKYLYDEVKEY